MGYLMIREWISWGILAYQSVENCLKRWVIGGVMAPLYWCFESGPDFEMSPKVLGFGNRAALSLTSMHQY